MDLEFHEAAGIFPLLEGPELEALADDIDARGLDLPIEIYEGKILDGRNRYRACLLRGSEPDEIEVDPDDPVAYVISANLHRRHLDESQRAMVVAHPLAFEYFKREAKKRQQEHGGTAPGKHSPPIDGKCSPKYRGEASNHAASTVNVSPRTVDRARQVYEGGSAKLLKAVNDGEVSVTAGALLADKRPKAKQNELLEVGKEAVQAEVKKLRPKTGKKSAKKTTPQLVQSILKDIKTLMAQVKQSTKGTALQRERVDDDLRLCRTRVKEACQFLV